jgi:rsbT co-antagonist protein RsbR
MAAESKRFAELLRSHRTEILDAWLRHQLASVKSTDLISEADLKTDSQRFLDGVATGLASGSEDLGSRAWEDARAIAADLSRSRAKLGFSPGETATFVFSLKQALFDRLAGDVKDGAKLAGDLWSANLVLDKLGLLAIETHMLSRDEMIRRQQQDLLELSTPVVKLWDRVLALPIIGTLDSARTQSVMESLLQAIVDNQAEIAIIDITGVPTVDTLVAQHLLKTVAAARLMGADCIISGIRPQIAQTIVHLGVSLDVTTKATMADAFSLALRRLGMAVGKARSQPSAEGATRTNG